MVKNYQNTCSYRIGKLSDFVYLLPKYTTAIKYTVDNQYHDLKIISITATDVIKLETSLTKFELTESLSGRLNFDSTVTVRLNEKYSTWVELLKDLRFNDYYVVFEDRMGTQFIQSPEFTSDIEYSYQFGSSSYAEIKFKCNSNFPNVQLQTKITPTQTIKNDCTLNDGEITGLWLTPYNYCFANSDIDGEFDTITITGGESLHIVDFSKGSFSFKQEYNGQNFTERLQFIIPFDGYMSYWPYNLVEYTQNLYAIAFQTHDSYIAAGFEHGFEPSYVIETSESPDEMNKITVTLYHYGQNSIIHSDGEPEIITSVTEKFVPVTQALKDPVTGINLPYYFCTTKTESIYTLVQMVTESGIPTDRYMCLDGYEQTYQNLDIVGSYDDDADLGFSLTFENYECSYKDNCELEHFPKSVYTFKDAGETQTTPIKGPCPWTIHSLPAWITADITEGQGGINYNVTFTCTLQGTETPVNGSGYIQSFDNVGLIQFICQKEPDWFKPYSHSITAAKQTVTSYVYANHYTICEVPEGVTVKKVAGTRKIEITVPENQDTNDSKVWRIKLCSPYYEDGYITITQDKLYTEWREITGEYMCDSGNSYKKLRLYKGYFPDSITIYAGQQRTGSLIITNDERCKTQGATDGEQYSYEWVTGYEECKGKDLYEANRKRETHDGWQSSEWTDEYQFTNLIEAASPQCEDMPSTPVDTKYIIDESEFICDGTTSYYVEYQWETYDNVVWTKSDPEVKRTSSTVRKEKDHQCGEPIEDPATSTQWVVTDGYVCENGDKYSRLRLQRSDNGGVTWYNEDIYRKNRLIEQSSSDCENWPEKVEDWIYWEGITICSGFDEYYVNRYAYTYDQGQTWYVDEPPVYMPVGLAKKNSEKCGYEDNAIYRWNNNTGYTLCKDGNLYNRNDYEKSTDGGETWAKTGVCEIGELILVGSTQCYEVDIQTEYRLGEDWQCNGCHSYYLMHKWESQDNRQNWYDTGETFISDSLRMSNDPACGCVAPVEPIYDYRLLTGENDYICD